MIETLEPSPARTECRRPFADVAQALVLRVRAIHSPVLAFAPPQYRCAVCGDTDTDPGKLCVPEKISEA